MKRLYRVEAAYYVMAEDRSEAENTCPDNIRRCVTSVSEATTVSVGWLESIPYGGDDDRTCGEIIRRELGI